MQSFHLNQTARGKVFPHYQFFFEATGLSDVIVNAMVQSALAVSYATYNCMQCVASYQGVCIIFFPFLVDDAFVGIIYRLRMPISRGWD